MKKSYRRTLPIYKGTPPNGFLDRIKLILKDDYLADNQNLLIEENTDNTGLAFTMERIIHNNNDNTSYLLYRFDREPSNSLFPFPYFKLTDEMGKRLGVAKTCDYVMFVEKKEDKNYILLFELKLGKDDPKPQLEQMKYFVEFIQNRAARAGIDITADIRKIGITNLAEKQGTRAGGQNVGAYDADGFLQLCNDKFLFLKGLLK